MPRACPGRAPAAWGRSWAWWAWWARAPCKRRPSWCCRRTASCRAWRACCGGAWAHQRPCRHHRCHRPWAPLPSCCSRCWACWGGWSRPSSRTWVVPAQRAPPLARTRVRREEWGLPASPQRTWVSGLVGSPPPWVRTWGWGQVLASPPPWVRTWGWRQQLARPCLAHPGRARRPWTRPPCGSQ
jgi:hypothetical protein